MHLFHYKEYVEKWDEIAALFSPEAVRAGALDKYIEGAKGKKGTADVDDDFLRRSNVGANCWRRISPTEIKTNS